MSDVLNQEQKKNYRIFLAPMDGYTDNALRDTIANYSIRKPDMLFTEFVNVEALRRDVLNAKRIITYTESQRPVVAQLFGRNPESFYEATLKVIDAGFDGVDLNMGCTAKKIANRYEGAGMINHPDLAIEIIDRCREAIAETKVKSKKTFTFTVKTRLGYMSDTADTWLPLLDEQNLDFITLHGRFVQWYGGQADWERIAKFAHEMKTPLVGNGDIKTVDEAYEKQDKYNLYGTMIGRNGQILLGTDIKHRLEATIYYLETHEKLQVSYFRTPKYAFDSTKKVVLWLLKGMDDTNTAKNEILHVEDYASAINILRKVLERYE